MRPPAQRTLSAYTLDTLRQWILSGRCPPGARLDQRQLAVELGVSLIPLRESLRQLEAEGLVQIAPHRGAFVAERSEAEELEISRIREVLEELATQLAVPRLTADVLTQLRANLTAMQAAITAADMPRFLELNQVFHATLYAASEQQLLLRLIDSLQNRFKLYRQRHQFDPVYAARSLKDHRAIVRACAAQDAAGAGRLMRAHIHRATQGTLARMRAAKAASPPG